MKPNRIREEQIIGILREQEAGAKTAYVLPYRRFAVALTDYDARLGADVDCSGNFG